MEGMLKATECVGKGGIKYPRWIHLSKNEEKP